MSFIHSIQQKKTKGFTFIEAMILLVLFSIATIAFYKMYTESVRLIIEAKRRIAAIEIAKERMEQIRNIPYDEIGTKEGSPSGHITQDETVDVNHITFRIITDVLFIDDPNDGLINTPSPNNDDNFNDYKRVHIFVLWGKATDQAAVETIDAKSDTWSKSRVELVSTFVPPGGIEGPSLNGVLSVNTTVIGQPLPYVSVAISCSGCNDGGTDINSSAFTDSQGNLIRSMPPSNQYQLTLTKDGYQTIHTKIPYNGTSAPDDGSYTPQDPHPSVLLGKLTTITVEMAPLHDFVLSVDDPFCQPISGTHTINLTGGYLIGSDPTFNPNKNIYALDSFFDNTEFTTDASGTVTIYTDTDDDGTIETNGDDKASAGAYTLDVAQFESKNPNLTFWRFKNYTNSKPNVMALDRDYNTTSGACSLIALDKTKKSIFVTVRDATDSNNIIPIEGATVRVQNTSAAYSSSGLTDVFGKVYFPNNQTTPLVAGDYEVRVSMDGYKVHTQTVSVVSGLKIITVDLTPNP